MPVTYHVFGAAVVSVGTGAAGALETLGVTEDGVDIEIEDYLEPVRSDVAGPRVPADLQRMLGDAWIRLRLAAWDEAVLNKVLAKGDSTGPTAGLMATPGRLVGTSGDALKLAIAPGPAGSSESPWYFPTAIPRQKLGVKLGTQYGVFSLPFYAWPFISAASVTGKDKILYQRVIP